MASLGLHATHTSPKTNGSEPLLFRARFELAREAIRGGEPVAASLRRAKQSLVDAGFLRIDYLALVDAATLDPLDEAAGDMRLIAAAVIGSTRLIDNVAI